MSFLFTYTVLRSKVLENDLIKTALLRSSDFKIDSQKNSNLGTRFSMIATKEGTSGDLIGNKPYQT